MMQLKQIPNDAEQVFPGSHRTPSRPLSGQVQELRNRLGEYYDQFPKNDAFLGAFEEALLFTPNEDQRVYTRILMEEADTRLVLLGLHQSQPFPVHDHAGTAACHVILYGCLRVRHYSEAKIINHAMVQLDCISDRELNAGEFEYVDQERAIHGLDSVSQRVLVLNLQSKHMDSLERHWYFPATMEQKEKPLWFRVRRKQD